MDIRWRDGSDNVLNANKDRIIYLEASTDVKTVIKKEDVKRIVIEDGMMHIFKDFENDLELSIIIPKKRNRDAVKIFNEYDKTGTMLKGKSSNFLIDLILESSMVTGNPLFGIVIFLFIFSIALGLITFICTKLFGDIGLYIARTIIFGYPVYLIISYILLRVKRKKIKEIENKYHV